MNLLYCSSDYVIFFAIVIIIYTRTIKAKLVEDINYPPCSFNPLCTCSKTIPDLGIVRCRDIHMPRIPESINTSKVFIFHLENNGLRLIEPYFLQSTGLYKLTIASNPIASIPDSAFFGLERSLWELDLNHNQLTAVPYRAIRYLQKLRVLDLAGNGISEILPENWRGLENSLQTLILSENAINHLEINAFAGLAILETLDLRGNNLRNFDPIVFKNGMRRLANLNLADNQLTSIPYQAVLPLKILRNIDLSYNNIKNMRPQMEERGNVNEPLNFMMNLNMLRLDYNQIDILEQRSFQYFDTLNITYLDGNPLTEIEENAFRPAKIRELYIRFCGLSHLSPSAFSGLENYLHILDLSSNNLISLPEMLFYRMDNLRILSLRDNIIAGLNYFEMFNIFQYSLYNLDVSGPENQPVALQELRRLRNLQYLTLSRLPQPYVRPEDFIEFGMDLEDLRIISADLQGVRNHAFQFVHSLKRVDFSDNIITSIENEAFAEIGHSLLALKLSHAFAQTVADIPFQCFKPLIALKILNLNNNKFTSVPDTSFHFLKKLTRLELQDNSIEHIHKGTFQGDIHSSLQDIYLSFNNIKQIRQHTFVDLASLEQIHLDDNEIESLDRRSFMNLEHLKRLNLKGNKISSISYEAFQNLPELDHLDMSYNQLRTFEFQAFDQVGTLSMLHVDVSHNQVIDLITKLGTHFEIGMNAPSLHSNIKILDLSYNNIAYIGKNFFQPAILSLTQLDLNHNSLFNATKNIFGNLPHLHYLDISYNKILEIDFDAFRNTKKLQVFSCSHNVIAEVPLQLFRFILSLRLVDLSYNRLRFLPDNLFREEGLEILDLSHNQLNKLPLNAFNSAAASTLCALNLASNSISLLAHEGLFIRFQRLLKIDLSYNQLIRIDVAAFGSLPKLSCLDVSHNSGLSLERSGQSFNGIEDTLLDLRLDNISLTYVPELPLPNLLSLSLAYNFLPTIPPEMFANLSSLRVLNLAFNDFTMVPIVIQKLTKLKKLTLNGNPITVLSNTSLNRVADHLEELDISNLDLYSFEIGVLSKMYALRTLKMSIDEEMKKNNLPKILSSNDGLRNLEINVDRIETNLGYEFYGQFPQKIRNVTLNGKGLKSLSSNILEGIKYPNFHLCLQNTSISKVPKEIFQNLPSIKNISIDVRDNIELQSLENPSTGPMPNLRDKIFLIDLKILGNPWNCDCELGWIEVWQRKKRQYICGSTPSKKQFFREKDYSCREPDDDLRVSLCYNKANQSIIEIMKTDIECGWSDASTNKGIILILWGIIFILIIA